MRGGLVGPHFRLKENGKISIVFEDLSKFSLFFVRTWWAVALGIVGV